MIGYVGNPYAAAMQEIHINDHKRSPLYYINNYFGDGVTSQNIFFKIISDFNIVGDGVPISQNNLIKFYVILQFCDG